MMDGKLKFTHSRPHTHSVDMAELLIAPRHVLGARARYVPPCRRSMYVDIKLTCQERVNPSEYNSGLSRTLGGQTSISVIGCGRLIEMHNLNAVSTMSQR
jgi:hypothetical protein